MANDNRDKALYSRLRANGIRKRTARELSRLPMHVSKGRAPKRVRDAVDGLEAVVVELKGHTRRGERRKARKRSKA
jgi:hypothetical protein